MANVIVILYVIVAMLERPRAEDDKKTIEKKSE
jgi:hypothetical protein